MLLFSNYNPSFNKREEELDLGIFI